MRAGAGVGAAAVAGAEVREVEREYNQKKIAKEEPNKSGERYETVHRLSRKSKKIKIIKS